MEGGVYVCICSCMVYKYVRRKYICYINRELREKKHKGTFLVLLGSRYLQKLRRWKVALFFVGSVNKNFGGKRERGKAVVAGVGQRESSVTAEAKKQE